MRNPTTAEQAVAYITNESKTMTATCYDDEVIINTDLGEFTLSQDDKLYLADKWKHKHAWYTKMPLEQLAETCHEELEEFIRTGDKTYLGNAEEGLAYLAEQLRKR
jgi:hypothetical protein